MVCATISGVKIDFYDALQGVLSRHKEYHPNAYQFLYLATNPASYAVRVNKKGRQPKHLTAAEYYAALCRLAQQEYGPLARTVFEYWGLKTTQDVANATYFLIEAGIFCKQEQESREDFLSLPPLAQELEAPYTPAHTAL